MATAVGALFTGCALVVASVVAWRQNQLTARLAREQAALSQSIHREQRTLSQRQLFLPLWQYLDKLADINPAEPVWPDVKTAANTLELIAVLCEGEMVDKDIILRTFAARYLDLYTKIQNCSIAPPNQLSGPQMLQQNPAARAFYSDLEKLAQDANRVKPLPGR